MHRVYGVDDRPGPGGDPFSHHPPPKAQGPLPEQMQRQQHTALTADAGLQAIPFVAGSTHLFVVFCLPPRFPTQSSVLYCVD